MKNATRIAVILTCCVVATAAGIYIARTVREKMEMPVYQEMVQLIEEDRLKRRAFQSMIEKDVNGSDVEKMAKTLSETDRRIREIYKNYRHNEMIREHFESLYGKPR